MRCQYLYCALWAAVALADAPDAEYDNNARPTQGYTFGTPGRDAKFDYVIVGGGTAGLTVATRLAENPSLSIAVIEAGGFYEQEDGNLSVVPAYDAISLGSTIVDWNFLTTPQAGAANRKVPYFRGKMLGGSSARNFLLYHRPTVGSLNQWADQVGDQSYSFNNFFPFFKKSVHYTPPSIEYKNSSNVQADGGFIANGGPLQVSFGKYEDPFGTWLQKGFQAVGQAAIKGFQVGKLIGSAYMPFTEDPSNGHRSSSESSFLESTKSERVKLKVYKNTLAEKIVFKRKDNCATGVTVSSYGASGLEGKPYTLHAKKEVIVSAGAFQSPQLLMVSGIGPRDTLRHLKIPVLHDSPGVGQNLWDQPFFSSSFRVDLSSASASATDPVFQANAVSEYLKHASGPLTNADVPVISWEKLPKKYADKFSDATKKALATFSDDWPQLEFLGSDSATGAAVSGNSYATLSTCLITPLSRGNISITSNSMADPPLINPNWLTAPADAEVAIAAFKRQRDVWKQISAITIGQEFNPGPKVNTDAEILAYIQGSLSPIWHASATCKMGKKNDPMAVIDSQTKVYGTQNLRVVDASSFPFLPPGHPQSTIYALAEKIAAEILERRS